MTIRTILLGSASAIVMSAGLAAAQSATDQIIADLQNQGFTAIEIKTGPSQIKAEAVRGDTKLEVVYDAATGQILKQETESARGEDISPGVSIDVRDEDFVDAAGYDDDDDHDDDDRDDYQDDDDDRDDDDRDDHEDDDDDDDRDDDRDEDDHDDDRDRDGKDD
ncbi:PepSY domain-containing protein [Roseivivax sp. CAU 1753]